MKFLTKLLSVLLLLMFTMSIAQAQISALAGDDASVEKSIQLPTPLTPESARNLVSTMSDQQVRALLLERLDAVAKEKAAKNINSQSGAAATIGSWFTVVGSSISEAVERVPRIWTGLKTSTGNFRSKHGSDGLFNIFVIILGSIAAGYAAETIVNRLVRSKRENLQNYSDTLSLGQTLKILGRRLFWDIIALVVFFVVTRVIAQNFVPEDFVAFVTSVMASLVVLPRLTWVFSRMIFAPSQPEMRLLSVDDDTARFFHWNTIAAAAFVGFMGFIIGFHADNGVAVGETRLGFWLNNILFIWFIVAMYVSRKGGIQALIGSRPEEVTPMEMKIAKIFPWFAIGFIVLMWFVVQIIAGYGRYDLLGGRQYIILAIVVFIPGFDTMIRALVRHLVPPMQGEGVIAKQAYYSTKRSYIRIGRVLMFGLVIVLIAELWNIDFENLASAGLGVQFAGRFFEVLIVLAFGYLIWEVVTLLINRKLAAEMTAAGFDLDDDEPGGGEGGGAGGSRLSTVLPMIRLTLQFIIAAMTILIALSNTGFDITPLLAGAGVLGIAIGFGAQSLVKDVVSGIFFLVEDAFRVGEYLNINETVGTVEKISLRSMQLRHHNGPVHTIPFGEIPKVTNMSRDWVIMKLKWTLPFGTDPQKIKKLFKEIGKEMMDAEYAENIIQTFKSQGVYDVDDVGIVIRGKFMAKPGTQWIMRKDVYARVQKKLEANGIEFARREVKVNVPGLNGATDLDENSKNAISAAAALAAQPVDGAKKPEPDTP